MHSYLMKICKSYDQSREALTHHEPLTQTVESFFWSILCAGKCRLENENSDVNRCLFSSLIGCQLVATFPLFSQPKALVDCYYLLMDDEV